ncbi:MAG: adenylate/guanylate cyclase domain-containing protein [Desulfomonilaceae bacterium]|nr:adenylate/guanylate cyclase domain-containing protein [Desulfomonilaceae bacterium]
MDDLYEATYKDRFENLFRVAKKISASLNIVEILETIRDEAKIMVPHAKEACLILVDPEAPSYTSPLHCAVEKGNVNCHLCKRGNEIVQRALGRPMTFQCTLYADAPGPVTENCSDRPVCEVALPVYDGSDPLAVLNIVAEEGRTLGQRDIVLLKDLAELTTNAIINAKKHSLMRRDKLTLERILGHIRTFVPETVQRIVEKNPDSPLLDRTELDVSILFLDVADYTRISETFAQDKVNFVIEKYFSAFLDVIYSQGGDVNETAGDGLMAIFQGDEKQNALNAVHAAMGIRKRTDRINKELQGMFYPICVNMGINSGTASVGMTLFKGEVGTRRTFTASGRVTNLASRIAAAAVDGDILVGPETARRVRDSVMLFERGGMQFKNVKDTVQIYSPVHR